MAYRLEAITLCTRGPVNTSAMRELWGDIEQGKLPILFDSEHNFAVGVSPVLMRFDTMQDGKCIEILHIGSYDDEPASFEKMAQFAKDHELTCKENSHREIHLNNPKRVETNRLKTILRYPIITSK